MRLLSAAIILCSFISATALAQTMPAPGMQNNSRSFGGTTCRQQVVCKTTVDASEMISIANNCINKNFGYPIGDGFFDEYAGLDKNNCLTAKPNVLPKGVGLQLSPICCVVQPNSSVDTCYVHCDLVSVAPGH